MIQALNNHLESRPKSLNPYRWPLIKVALLRLAAGYIIVDTLNVLVVTSVHLSPPEVVCGHARSP